MCTLCLHIVVVVQYVLCLLVGNNPVFEFRSVSVHLNCIYLIWDLLFLACAVACLCVLIVVKFESEDTQQ